ncbi:hypothetical protein CANARDRAFT_26641 [[Candida] arabinofermentans NRRL YB-2248]|uniref:Central kinetochore subunit MCM21 n=1 Tax=[Candida] arabinofermentans NRRL YB-2248 TaxID=983967 RepID=A0A1E4T635_9ASCO|nr:hypothetical protein CANARDRAFT_26641 [[Candida] arabinofermentans NRRL YB-2248]
MSALERYKKELESLEAEVDELKRKLALDKTTILRGSVTPEPNDQLPTDNKTPHETTSNKRELEMEDITPPRTHFGNRNKRAKPAESVDYIPEIAHHEYFDELINNLMVSSLNVLEKEETLKEENTALEKENKVKESTNKWNQLILQHGEKIQTENIYRLAGITTFPVNNPNKTEVEDTDGDDRFLGIRFDVFDKSLAKFSTPHYVILKKLVKNDNWFVFKTTIPRFVPLNILAAEYLNFDLFMFSKQVRKHLVQLQLKKSTFLDIQSRLKSPSRMEYDIEFSKVNIKVLNRFEMILICDLFKVTNVIVVGDLMIDAEGANRNVSIKDAAEVLFRGCEIRGLKDSFFKIMEECGLFIER